MARLMKETKVILRFNKESKRYECYDPEGNYVTTLTSVHGLSLYDGWGIRHDKRIEHSFERESYYFVCGEMGNPLLQDGMRGLVCAWKQDD